MCQDLPERPETDPQFNYKIITVHVTWGYMPDPVFTSVEELISMLRKVQVHSIVKTMLIVSFETHGVVHHESVPQGQTVSQRYYADILQHLREHVQQTSMNSGPQQICILTQGNAPAHTVSPMHEFLAENKITVVPHHLYSPYLMLY
jgi:hypothetical protein